MNQSHSEIAFNAMLLGVNLAEAVHGIQPGSALYESLPDRLLEVASGELIFTASGAEIRRFVPAATEKSRAMSQRAMQDVAKLIVEFVRSGSS